MKKVYELLNKNKPLPGDVGIEIEVEGENLNIVDSEYWKTENDGSLRGDYPNSCAEFVLKKPILIDQVAEAVKSLVADLPRAKFHFSFRTSVHIHLNVQELTEVQVMNLMYTYLLLEEPLINFCGRERKGNRFCLRLVDAEGMLRQLSEVFERGLRRAMAFNENDIRYAALNIASLRKYGSIEFRAMRGNIDPETIYIWAFALYSLREYAVKMKDPKAIYEEFRNLEPKGFMESVLGKGSVAYFIYPRMVKEMQRSFSLSIDLPHTYREPMAPAAVHNGIDYNLLLQQIYGPAGVTEEKITPEGLLKVKVNDRWVLLRDANEDDMHRVAQFNPDNMMMAEF